MQHHRWVSIMMRQRGLFHYNGHRLGLFTNISHVRTRAQNSLVCHYTAPSLYILSEEAEAVFVQPQFPDLFFPVAETSFLAYQPLGLTLSLEIN